MTSHSWQSMKYRYRVGLSKKQHEEVNVKTKEEETETAEGEAEVIYLDVVGRYFVMRFSVTDLLLKLSSTGFTYRTTEK